jgi:hypothetical protein
MTFSALVAPYGHTKCIISEPGNGRFAATYDLVAGTTAIVSGGTASAQSFITPYPGGWWLLEFSGVMPSGLFGLLLAGYPNSGATIGPYGAVYAGDNANGILVQGIQLEDGSRASSRVLTLGSATTRTADLYSRALAASEWGGAAGTFAARWSGVPFGYFATAAQDFESYVYLGADECGIMVSGSDEAYFAGPGSTAGRAAMAWRAGDAALSLSGAAVTTAAPGGFPSPTTLYIGGNSVGGLQPNCVINAIKAWATRMPDSFLREVVP